ncbi:MAG: ISL3 family transposase [Anaerolineae bacterium]
MKMPPQLPPPRKKIAKDAAQGVKRVDSLTTQAVTAKTLSELLCLPGMRVTRFAVEEENKEQYLHLFCEHEHDVAICPRCMTATTEIHEQKDRCVRHLDIWGMRTLVHFPQRRFDCDGCGKPFTENLEWIDAKRRQTSAFEMHIYERVKHKTPRKQVALQGGLNEATVLDIFKRQAKRATRQADDSRVRVLGVDEISLRKGHKRYALVLSDLVRRRVIAVLPNRLKKTFEQWLESLTEAERQAIRVVSMDMWEAYRQAVRKRLRHAKIVADRFHVMKQLNHQIDLMRRSMQRKAKKEGDEALYQALKGSRWVLLKNRSALAPEQEAQLETILAVSDELRVIYLLKEEFRTICDKITDQTRAQRFLWAWTGKALATGSRYLTRFVRTLRNWWHEFLNYFDDRVTQGFVEGINRAIRGIINRAFGFRNFDNFRLQVLVECGGV